MLLVSGAMGCSENYQPDLCTFVNIGVAQCDPTDVSKPSYDLKAVDMIGYTCLSPSDFSEGKKRARKLLENLD